MGSKSLEATEPPGQPLTHLVALGLRQAILNGELRPGERIKQDAIARQYGTSRIPVREALRELRSEGLVTIEPDVGARVAALEFLHLIEAYLMREALEPLAVVQSIPHLTPNQLAQIGRALEESERWAAENNLERHVELDRVFHTTIFQGARMDRLYSVIEGLWDTTARFRRVNAALLPRGLEATVLEHRLLFSAVQRRAAEDASQIHQVHIRHARTILVAHVQDRERTSEDHQSLTTPRKRSSKGTKR